MLQQPDVVALRFLSNHLTVIHVILGKVVRLLLSTPGVEVDASDERGTTALMHAAKIGNLDV